VPTAATDMRFGDVPTAAMPVRLGDMVVKAVAVVVAMGRARGALRGPRGEGTAGAVGATRTVPRGGGGGGGRGADAASSAGTRRASPPPPARDTSRQARDTVPSTSFTI